MDATDPIVRDLRLEAGSSGLAAIVFAGKRLNEPVAWRGPIVMNTDAELQSSFREYSSGTFLKRRVDWDYRSWAAFPDNLDDTCNKEL